MAVSKSARNSLSTYRTSHGKKIPRNTLQIFHCFSYSWFPYKLGMRLWMQTFLNPVSVSLSCYEVLWYWTFVKAGAGTGVQKRSSSTRRDRGRGQDLRVSIYQITQNRDLKHLSNRDFAAAVLQLICSSQLSFILG